MMCTVYMKMILETELTIHEKPLFAVLKNWKQKFRIRIRIQITPKAVLFLRAIQLPKITEFYPPHFE